MFNMRPGQVTSRDMMYKQNKQQAHVYDIDITQTYILKPKVLQGQGYVCSRISSKAPLFL